MPTMKIKCVIQNQITRIIYLSSELSPNEFKANKSNLIMDRASFLAEGLLSLGPYKHHPLSLQIEYAHSVSIDLHPFKKPLSNRV